MIIPIGHEHSTQKRRLPWVTFGIMILCLAAFFLTKDDSSFERKLEEKFRSVAEYYIKHHYLTLDLRLEGAPFDNAVRGNSQTLNELADRLSFNQPDNPQLLAQQQAELDRRTEELFAVIDNYPIRKWGFVPAHFSLLALFTSMFMHAGWLHLLGNMLFLQMSGPFLEDVWGRPIFLAFYLLGGIFSALMFSLHYPHLDIPLVGASGAIAAVMGAFLIRYWNVRIKFIYWFIKVDTFAAPAWIMLPLWFFIELSYALIMDSVAPEGGGGVAYWAHVWGFVFGLGAALAMRQYKVEERYIHHRIESKITLVENPVIERALNARSEGRSDEAVSILRKELQHNPANTDAAFAYWSLSLQMENPYEAAPFFLRLIREELRQGAEDLVLTNWYELRQNAPNTAIDPGLEMKLAKMLLNTGKKEAAAALVQHALESAPSSTPAAVLLRLVRLAKTIGSQEVLKAANRILKNPGLPPETLKELEQFLGKTRKEVPSSPELSLRVINGVPKKIKDRKLIFSSDKEEGFALTLELVKLVAVVGIRQPDEAPLLVLDLLLDTPWNTSKEIRVVRMLSNKFNPQNIVENASDTLEAFRRLVDIVLLESAAEVFPDAEAVRGSSITLYSSLEQYEKALLRATKNDDDLL